MFVEHHVGTASLPGAGVGEKHILLGPSGRHTGGRLIVFLHALGGSALGIHTNADLFGLRTLADRFGIYTVATDMGGDNWGYNYQSRVDAAIAWAVARCGVVSSSVALMMQSMGNYPGYNYIADNPDKVVRFVSLIPNVRLAVKYADAAFTASINAAAGGDATAHVAAADPWARQAAIASARAATSGGCPGQAWLSNNDPYESVATMQTHHANIGGNVEEHNMGDINHSAAGVDAADVVAFLAAGFGRS